MGRLVVPPELCVKVSMVNFPVLRFNVPALLKAPIPLVISGPEDCTVKVAPDWLLNTEPSARKLRKLLAPVRFQVAVPALSSVRPSSTMVLVPVKLIALLAAVDPLPDIVPADQLIV